MDARIYYWKLPLLALAPGPHICLSNYYNKKEPLARRKKKRKMVGSTTIRRPTFSRSCSNTFVGEETWCFLRPATDRATCRCRNLPTTPRKTDLRTQRPARRAAARGGSRRPDGGRVARETASQQAGLYYTEYFAKAILWCLVHGMAAVGS